MQLVERTEHRRQAAQASLDPGTQAKLGQFFTNAPTARLMASMPRLDDLNGTVRILDPGAGAGSLGAALVERIAAERPDLKVHLVAAEMDPAMVPVLAESLADCGTFPGVATDLVHGDFIDLSTGLCPDPRVSGPFDLVILNPPYLKVPSGSPYRAAVASVAADPPNMYAAFWALSVAAAMPGGQVVAIVPRSWANGSYFEQFRHWLLDRLSLNVLHVFESRSTVFKDGGVLQENVIVSGTVGPQAGQVVLSTSNGHTDHVTRQQVPIKAVLHPGDRHRFVRFTDGGVTVPSEARHTLAELGLKVSTGPVVDFRSRDWLATEEEPHAVPLIYPGNVRGGSIQWPRPETGKPQWYRASEPAANKWVTRSGTYTLIKRFSAKEERRRIVAAVCDMPDDVALENHLNYIHENGHGLTRDLAAGLSVWLNSTVVDQLFRTFSGHTQVNATDLRTLPFPSRVDLEALGRAIPGPLPRQEEIDLVVANTLIQIRRAS